MGGDGCDALFGRAFLRTQALHAVVTELRDPTAFVRSRERLSAAVEAHGREIVGAAVESLLAAVIDILGRLIGEDMAIRIIDHDTPAPETSEGGSS